MHIQISAPQQTAPTVTQFVEEKVAKLEHFLDQVLMSEVYLQEDSNDPKSEKLCTIRVQAGQGFWETQSRSNSFERATLEAVQAIIRQFRRWHELQPSR